MRNPVEREMIGASAKLRAALEQVNLVAPADCAVWRGRALPGKGSPPSTTHYSTAYSLEESRMIRRARARLGWAEE